jgi:methionyl-tRNA formyltransferase
VKLSVIGQAAFGADTVEALLGEGHEIVAISAPETVEGKVDPLWAKAEELSVPVIDTRILAKRQPQWLADKGPELGVMAFVTAILPRRVLETPSAGTIEYHPSLLPRHRGRSGMNWAIIQGDKVTGLTVFWVEEGVDTGPILLQKKTAIDEKDTMGSLYFEKLYPMGIEALKEAVRLVEAGEAPRIEQDESQATYEPPCEDEHAGIDWSAPARQVYDLIRGCNPRPGAHTTLNGEMVRVFDVELQGESLGEPGVVAEVTDQGFVVGLDGGSLRVVRVMAEEGKKVAAGPWAAEVGLRPGAALGGTRIRAG